MARNTAAATVLATLAILLLCAAFLAVAAAGAVGPAPALSARPESQRQRIRSLAVYAERVGAALELLVRGYSASIDNDMSSISNNFVEPQSTSPSVERDATRHADSASPLTHVMQYLQYPHVAVQKATQSALMRASAAAVLASVVLGAPISKDADALLTKVKTGSHPSVGTAATVSLPLAPLTNLRKTTRAAQSAAPAMGPAFPHAALLQKPLHKVGGHQVEALNSLRGEVIPLTCRNGLNAFSSDAIVGCRNSPRTYTAAEYVMLSPIEREQCNGFISEDGPLSQTCVCAQDYYMNYNDDGGYSCHSRPLDVQVILEGAHLCFSEADAALGLPGTKEGEYCIKTARNSTLQLPVTWKYHFLSDDAMLAASMFRSLRTPPQVPPGTRLLRWVIMNSPSGPAMGTYNELSMNTNIFSYVVAGHADAGQLPPSRHNAGFYLSSNTELLSAFSFSAVFCFASPHKTKDQLKEVPLETIEALKEYLGSADGISSHLLTLNLSTVPDDFVEGNQMYVETGLKRGPSIYYYRVAHIHISFKDLPEPRANSHKYAKQFNPLYILLIAAVSAGVVGTGSAMLWYHCMADKDYDDRFVSDAQRKKAQKRQPESSGGRID
ncbi:hypothetical protein JIQ42_06927 [Leishmania sp. Namibia]|uniref:hypothetical protein n=1 Tax=Leishmania sp. Namibia TaxID=2802991 RepID=UPI001B6E98BE|nr:hypothetical protein JIQ42_06927 [Leishmania sp. Namibia]